MPYSATAKVLRYLNYRFNARTSFRVHSPFVFSLIQEVLSDDRFFYGYSEVEGYRKLLLQKKQKINVVDLGAGSATQKTNERRVADIAANAAVPSKMGRLLFRLVEHFQPAHILELGTSLGVGTMYLAHPLAHKRLISIEGDPASFEIAKQGLSKFEGIELKCGNFDEVLPSLDADFKPSLVYLDGNHTYDATMRYFELIIDKLPDGGLIIADDINWSEGMTKAWEAMCDHPEISLSIDLFRCGLLFKRTANRQKEHFRLQF